MSTRPERCIDSSKSPMTRREPPSFSGSEAPTSTQPIEAENAKLVTKQSIPRDPLDLSLPAFSRASPRPAPRQTFSFSL